jgi:hypothetical protein
VFLIGFMYLMPSGVAGAIRLARQRLSQKRVASPLPARDVQVTTRKEAR